MYIMRTVFLVTLGLMLKTGGGVVPSLFLIPLRNALLSCTSFP
jgi:hypothetical protein